MKTHGSNLTPGQAAYVVNRMISERRITGSLVRLYLGELSKEIQEVEGRLERLRSLRSPGADAHVQPARRPPGRPRTRPRDISPANRPIGQPPAANPITAAPTKTKRRRRNKANDQLQGRYLAHIRQVAPSKRGQYQRIAKDKTGAGGRQAAIDAMVADGVARTAPRPYGG